MYVILGLLLLVPPGVWGGAQDPCQEGHVWSLDNQNGHRSKGFTPGFSYKLKCDYHDVFDGKASFVSTCLYAYYVGAYKTIRMQNTKKI